MLLPDHVDDNLGLLIMDVNFQDIQITSMPVFQEQGSFRQACIRIDTADHPPLKIH